MPEVVAELLARALEALGGVPMAGLMFTIALGYSLGRLSVRQVSLGPAGATLLTALALGHLGLGQGGEGGEGFGATGFGLGALGFALFIYSVGFDAAPHFFASFRERRGWRFLMVGVTVNLGAVAATVALGSLFGLDASTSAGLLAGALTSAPTYAAASEVAPDPARLAVAFAITYPIGLVGVVLLIQVIPRLLRQDLARGSAGGGEDRRVRSGAGAGGRAPEVSRFFEVQSEDVEGRTLESLDLIRSTGCVLTRVHAGDRVLLPVGDTVLERGDRVVARGRPDELRALERRIGPEIWDPALHESRFAPRRVLIANSEVVGRTLEELRIIQRHHCVITRIERGSLVIEPDPGVALVRDDVVEVVGARDDVRAAAGLLGRFEPSLKETDVAVYAGGILLGLLLGAAQVRVLGLDLSLGSAGGLLVVGLLLGWRQRLGPFRTHVPREARQLVRDLGILLFVAETGLAAGGELAQVLRGAPWETLAAGIGVNLLAVLGALALALRALALRPVDAWGSVCGGLTSSAALHAVRRVAEGNEATISYAAAYAVASVLATVAGPVVVLLLR